MVTGALESQSLEQAVELVRRQRAVVLRGFHLLPGAESKWTLEHLEERIPSTGAEASKFSVYRATSLRKVFRYSGELGASDAYDIASEQQADRLLLSFRDFAQKKRACANGDGDGWAYYMWGVALRRTASGEYEGFNFGESVDADLANGPHWGRLEEIRRAGGWGELKQAQIFVGCENALTPCHYDAVHNAYAQVRGWKRFILLDPNYAGCLYPYPLAHPMDRCSRVDFEHPDYERFPRFREARAVEAVLGPGDLLVLPAGWWHHVQTLTEDSISVSFWFEDDRCGRLCADGIGSGPLGSLDRVLLAREAEWLLTVVLGASSVRSALGQLRGMLGGEAPKPNADEVLPCCYLLWRFARVLGPGGVRRFVRDLADDGRFAALKLRNGS